MDSHGKPPEFEKHLKEHLQAIEELQKQLRKVELGGGEERLAREKQRGKLTARERIALLQDPDSEFFELSPLAGFHLYDEPLASGGIITGIVKVADGLCMVIANDQTVKGGTYYPITVKKHLRAQDIAARLKLPCLYLVDSAGANLHYQADVFADERHFGRIFYEQARLNAAGIPQLSVVHGSCIAGGAYIPAMCQQTIMVKEQGHIFLAGPMLVKAAIGEDISSEELGGAKVHSEVSGLVDYVASSDSDAMEKLRELVAALPNHRITSYGCSWHKESEINSTQKSISPKHTMDEFLGYLPLDHKHPCDPRYLLACVLDSSDFSEFKACYDSHVVTGFGCIYGIQVGIVANHGVLHVKSAQKATHFIDLCSHRNIPLIFIQNVSGFMVGKQAEYAGIAKEGAKMVQAVATAEVPKITLIVGGSHGAGNYGMSGRGFLGDFVFTWPSARISIMGAEQAAYVMERLAIKTKKNFDKAGYMQRFLEQSSPYYATARLWDDGLIDPFCTREVLGLALAVSLQKGKASFKRGIVRM